jgi:NAD(P)-dependent dehydrogenase (short-subunit alcohol dehydrogenase family)
MSAIGDEVMSASRPFVVVTGASTGIGFELAKALRHGGLPPVDRGRPPAIEQATDHPPEPGVRAEVL